MSITNPVNCVIRFWNAEDIHPEEIHRQLVKVYGEIAKNEGYVCKWCSLFNERTDVHNEERSECPNVITEDMKDRVDAHVCENRQFTTADLHEVLPCFTICPL
jgi:hypothetical protein